jgi:murein DD-endopeptidase MepM/ murein hydrolase activator NlpD
MSYQSKFARRADHGGNGTRGPQAAVGAANPADTPAGYTLSLGRRQLRVRPLAFWSVIGLLTVMAAWSAATAAYFVFHDELLARLITRQAEMQYAYEDRIGDLRGQIDRLTSRQLLDQEQFEYKLDQIVRRQAALEARAAALSGMPEPVAKPAKPPVPSGATDDSLVAPKPSPINDTPAMAPLPERGARFLPRTSWPGATQAEVLRNAAIIEASLRALQSSLDRVDAHQTLALTGLAETYDFRTRRLRGVLADLGVDLTKVPPATAMATGGPFVPVMPQPDASTFDRQLHRISIARAQLERLNQALVTVPVRKPIPGELEMTSGFGVRLDPFLHAPAMHTGVDLRGNMGDPVRATAAGIVTQAGWSGGYGRMVEIDHGNGFATRYGHLSAIDVQEGQTVRIGQIVGRIGMTGRTTGPHLHYETRVDGEPVDPQKFLRAATRLDGTL